MIAIVIAMCLDVANINFLVYWELEDRESIHHKDKIVETKGDICKVRFGKHRKQIYEGKIPSSGHCSITAFK